jgi:L-ribulokinase
MPPPPSFSLGLDFGTGSLRALIVDTRDGTEIATSVHDFRSGDAGVLTDPHDPNLARQDPAEYVEGLPIAVRAALDIAAATPGFHPSRIVGIGVDTTGSTPIPVDAQGTPLGLLPQFRSNLAAMAWLWKDHTSFAEAAEITRRAQKYPYLSKCGGTYSSEWYWSKILHCERTAPAVAKAAHGWVECCDWVVGYLTGNSTPESIPRGICAAGHKAMYFPAHAAPLQRSSKTSKKSRTSRASTWDGLPSAAFLDSLSKGLSRYRSRFAPTTPSDHTAGPLAPDIAARLGLPAGIPVAVGAMDAHMGAVGAGCGPGTLVKIIGTSTCDCMVAPFSRPLPDIPGLCGIVPESILPNMYGIEAGQSAVGDIFDWWARRLGASEEWGAPRTLKPADIHASLTAAASKLRPGESGLVALDWHNGNRTVLVDPLLSGLIVGENLHTTPAEIYRALIEATAFGALKIIDRIEDYGVRVRQVVNCGGIADRSPLVMQIYADVTNRPMHVSRSAQTCALGAAVFGAVVGGAHKSVTNAQKAMTALKPEVFRPIPENVKAYRRLYKIYTALHDAFGARKPGAANVPSVMKDLLAIRREVRTPQHLP